MFLKYEHNLSNFILKGILMIFIEEYTRCQNIPSRHKIHKSCVWLKLKITNNEKQST